MTSMPMITGGMLKRAMAWAAQPYLCLGLAAVGLVVAAGPRDVAGRAGVTTHGGVEIEDVPPGAGPGWIEARARRHREACASCRRAVEDGRRRRGLGPPPG
jgi:hypothetical protein